MVLAVYMYRRMHGCDETTFMQICTDGDCPQMTDAEEEKSEGCSVGMQAHS